MLTPPAATPSPAGLVGSGIGAVRGAAEGEAAVPRPWRRCRRRAGENQGADFGGGVGRQGDVVVERGRRSLPLLGTASPRTPWPG